jgi:hypothetical protein
VPPARRHRGDLAVADEGPQLIRRVREQTVSVMTHPGQYDAGGAGTHAVIPAPEARRRA